MIHKFRAWDKVENKYFEPVYEAYKGNLSELVIGHNGYLIMRTATHDYGTHPDTKEELNKRFILEWSTGLKDKNGKEIWENDELQGSETSPKYTVVMESGQWGAKYSHNGNGGFVPIYGKTQIFEVVGNIHQDKSQSKKENK